MKIQIEIDFRTDDEILALAKAQILEFERIAKGSGFASIQANLKLNEIKKLSEQEIIGIVRNSTTPTTKEISVGAEYRV
jgi:hypothetical protein